jgi:hypothetical protein
VVSDARNEEVLNLVHSPAAREVLAQWADNNEITLLPADWTASGFTDAQLLGVYAHEAGRPVRGLIVKIKPRGRNQDREPRANHAARRAARSFGRLHLAGTPYDPVPFDQGGSITFQAVAGGGFGDLLTFDAMLEEEDDPADVCEQIVTSLLTEWNPDQSSNERAQIGPLLQELLGARLDSGGTLDASTRRGRDADFRLRKLSFGDLTLINPFAVALDPAVSAGREILTIRGKTHGDLHPGNLLVATASAAQPDFWLVDLARYSDRGLLPWDPAYLLVTAAASQVDSLPDGDRDSLRRCLLDFAATPDRQIRPVTLRRAIRGVVSAERARAIGLDLRPEWERLRLLCLTAAGLMLSGRSILPDRARDWCFWLSAQAVTQLFEMTPATGRRAGPGGAGHLPPERPAGPPRNLGSGAGGRPRPTSPLLDREPAREALRARLTDGPAGMVVLRGDEGVGKTLLVEEVLRGLGPHRPRICRHEAFSGIPFDVRTLTDDLADPGRPVGPAARPAHQDEEVYRSSVARFEAALHALGEEPVVIVVESAENLIRPGGPVLADLDLDEAFEMLAETEGHRVSVVLVTRQEPRSPQQSAWPTTQPPIHVPALPPRSSTCSSTPSTRRFVSTSATCRKRPGLRSPQPSAGTPGRPSSPAPSSHRPRVDSARTR